MVIDSEVEPDLAVSPKDSNVIIGVDQQDRWTGGQARGIVAGVSHDGGRTWRQVRLPLSACARRSVPFARAGDPWVSIGPDGTAYAIATGDGIAVTTSHDGGSSWTYPTSLDERTARVLPDKPTVTADPTHGGVAYAVWARVITNVQFDAMFAKTTDSGRSWSSPRLLIRHARDGGAISSQILVAPKGGLLYHLTNWEQGSSPDLRHPARLLIQRSTDGGSVWSKPQTLVEERTLGYARAGARGNYVRTGVEVPAFAIDHSSGALYAVWQDGRFGDRRFDHIAFSRSTDEGHTWSAPAQVAPGNSDLAAIPAVAVGSHGSVGVLYYSFRFGSRWRSPRIDARVFLAVSADEGKTFFVKQLAGPVDVRAAPKVLIAGGPRGEYYFLGDYSGLAARGPRFAAFFALPDPKANDPGNVYFAASPKLAV